MKLVRDKIPEIIYANGEIACLSVVDDGEYHFLLRRKLEEEVHEYLESDSAEELADILEVLYALASCTGLNEDALERLRKAKADDRGRFLQRIVWHGSRRLAGSAGDDQHESRRSNVAPPVDGAAEHHRRALHPEKGGPVQLRGPPARYRHARPGKLASRHVHGYRQRQHGRDPQLLREMLADDHLKGLGCWVDES
jgi:predicted house-cleaning noncanonical NTP pyrophosphatase (MazG superfamily)